MTYNQAVEEIEIEYKRAIEKFPKFNSQHEGFAVLKEEMDELWEAVRLKQGSPERLEKLTSEAIQVGAMALRFLTDVCPKFISD